MLCIVAKNSPFVDIPMDLDDRHDESTQKSVQKTIPAPRGTSIQVHNNDVLAGRGNGVAAHPGNQLFRDICVRYQQAYHDAQRTKKMAVAKAAIAEITSQNPPGRFLEKDRNNRWVLMAPKRILDKTSQALRDRPSKDSPASSTKSYSSAPPPPSGLEMEQVTLDTDRRSAPMDYTYAPTVDTQQQYPSQQLLSSSYTGGTNTLASSLYPAGITGRDSNALPRPLPPHVMSNIHTQDSMGVARMLQPPAFSCQDYNRDVVMAAAALLHNHQVMMDMDDQFSDAMEDPMNTSLEIFQLCRRKGYLGH